MMESTRWLANSPTCPETCLQNGRAELARSGDFGRFDGRTRGWNRCEVSPNQEFQDHRNINTSKRLSFARSISTHDSGTISREAPS